MLEGVEGDRIILVCHKMATVSGVVSLGTVGCVHVLRETCDSLVHSLD